MVDITPNDILNIQFRMTFRGYATDQVDDFLQQASDGMTQLLEENQRLRKGSDDLRERVQQYQQTEELLKNTLMLAERTAEETRQRADKEADLLRREMEQRMVEERTALDELHQFRLRCIAETRAVLQSQLALLDQQEKQFVK